MRLHFTLSVLCSSALAVDPLVDLTYAKYQGKTLSNGVNQWLSLRFAAPVIGQRRFAAPQDPLPETVVQDATVEGALCLSANNQEGLQFGNPKQPMAEDCLFVGVFAPANATEESNLPIMVFISGGGFTSNSNGNHNGSNLVEASGMNMIVMRMNYRVGILGFIAGTVVDSDANDAVTNNGLNDIVAAMRWMKQHAKKFGGNPNQIVVTGDSAGAAAIDILLTSNDGVGFPDLIAGAIVASTGWGGEPYATDRDFDFNNNVNQTGCLNATDPIDCMRALPIAEFQTKLAKNGWGPTIDGKLLSAPRYQLMEQGKFQKIPVIYGTASNEGTPDFISNQSATTDADIEKKLRNDLPSITESQVETFLTAYPTSLNSISFMGRDVSSKNDTLRRGKGVQWQRDAAFMTELKLTCVASFFSDMHAAQNNAANYHYRYNVLDTTPGGFADQGLFTPHVSELYAVWGPDSTDGQDPKCFKLATAEGGCATAMQIVQGYWISFVRTLNPNTMRFAGSPEWEPWTIAAPKRIVLDNGEAIMETMGNTVGEVVIAGMNQRQRCLTLTTPLAKANNQGLKKGETLFPFANGSAADPTIPGGTGVVQVGMSPEAGLGSKAGASGPLVIVEIHGNSSSTPGSIAVTGSEINAPKPPPKIIVEVHNNTSTATAPGKAPGVVPATAPTGAPTNVPKPGVADAAAADAPKPDAGKAEASRNPPGAAAPTGILPGGNATRTPGAPQSQFTGAGARVDRGLGGWVAGMASVLMFL